LAALLTTPAVLLRAIAYGESDRVVTLLGRSTGCVGAIARGARKSQRRFGGGLGLCAVGEAAMRERSGSELLVLERFEATGAHPTLGTDPMRMGHAGYVAELVSKLCAPRQPEPGIFDWLVAFLDLLETEGPAATRLRIFELGLLQRLGFAPALAACAVCGRDDLSTGDQVDVRWDPDRGGVVCRGCGARGRPMRPVVRMALARLARLPLAQASMGIAGSEREADAGAEADADEGPEPERAPVGQGVRRADVARGCRDALQELIGIHLAAPLKSLEFLLKLSNPVRPGQSESSQ
jgi:DNA repair protein RecO (recombination protein O)